MVVRFEKKGKLESITNYTAPKRHRQTLKNLGNGANIRFKLFLVMSLAEQYAPSQKPVAEADVLC
jgi:hypothetical protein